MSMATETKRRKIGLGTPLFDVIDAMSEGNPGAIRVCCEIVKASPLDGFITLLHLDDMGVRGSQIWVGFKDFANENLEDFVAAVFRRDPEMVRKINEQCPEHRAVTGGAS